MDTRLTPEKKFISKYLAQRFIGEEASEDECDKEAEFILEYITQSLLATVTPEKLKEGIEAIFIKYRKEFEKHPRIDFINFATQDTLTLLQRSTAQAVKELVKKERIEIGQYLKDNISEDLSWTKLISQLLKGQALKSEEV